MGFYDLKFKTDKQLKKASTITVMVMLALWVLTVGLIFLSMVYTVLLPAGIMFGLLTVMYVVVLAYTQLRRWQKLYFDQLKELIKLNNVK